MSHDSFLRELAADLRGPSARRRRLLDELRHHLDDATAAEAAAGLTAQDAEAVSLARLGEPAEIAASWQQLVDSRRRETRRRAAVLALATATACALAIAQHASGLRQPSAPCHTPAVVPRATHGDVARCPGTRQAPPRAVGA